MTEILHVDLVDDRSVVLACQRARRLASLLGCDSQDQARISTAVSEIARNAVLYAAGGRVHFEVSTAEPRELIARVVDHGSGIRELSAVLDGTLPTGTGIIAARRVMDRLEIDSTPAGTTVTLGKSLSRKAPPLDAQGIDEVRQRLNGEEPQSVYEEFTAQNQELARALDELREQQAKLAQVNAELEETNRGVVALYADLEEKADSLQRLNQQKTRFYSGMSHEFRTPINSILSISKILLDRLDGDLTAEQTIQVSLIQKSAKNLLEWVTDLLDIAKVEAGKLDVKPSEFVVGELLASLRGIMRPLLTGAAVQLIIEDPEAEVIAYTDEGKLSQILRNFVSNAIKFTEAGEIRVRAETLDSGDTLRISVSDTGIGIAPEHHARIFEDFSQVENHLQRRVRGTGLGLALSKRLAELLGGQTAVASQPGKGSTFSVELPRICRAAGATFGADAQPALSAPAPASGRSEALVLVIDDDEASRYVARQILADQGLEVVEASGGVQGLALAKAAGPRAIILDVAMPDMDGFQVLAALQADALTDEIPVILRTSRPLELINLAQLPGVIEVISKSPETGGDELQRAIRAVGVGGKKPATEVDYA